MMQLKKFRRPAKKQLLIIGGVTVVLAVLCAGGWWYNAGQASAAYTEQRNSYANQAKADFKKAADTFKVASKEADSKKTLEALRSLEATLTRQEQQVPALPRLLGVTVAPQEAGQKRDDTLQKIAALKTTVAGAVRYMEYQQATAATLQGVITKAGADANQQKALADAWAAMLNVLRSQSPPTEAAGMHQQLVTAVAAAHASLSALPDLFNKKDIPGFAAKQKEVEAHITTIRSLGDAVKTMADTHDAALAQDFAALNAVLQ